nr:testis-expressed sequence 2 protein [Tanacetum cinerariifolium]
MHKAFPLPVMEFPLPGEVSTASEESSHCQKKRDATAEKIAVLLKSSSNCQSKSYDSYANSDSTSVNEVTSDLLEGVMKLNERTNQPTEPKEPMAKPPTEPTVIHAARHVETHPQEPQEVSTSSKRSTESTSDKTTHLLDDEKFAESDEKTLFLDTEEHPPTPHDMTVMACKSIEDNQEVIFPTWQQPSPPQAMIVATNEENNDTIEAENDRLRRMGTRAKMLGVRKKLGKKLEEKRCNIEEKEMPLLRRLHCC